MIINLVYDASALAAPQSFRDGMNTGAHMLEAAFSDNITINISVHYGHPADEDVSEGGPSLVYHEPYLGLLNALVLDSKTSDDANSVASLPLPDPFGRLQGQSIFDVSSAQAKAMGLIAANGTAIDGAVTMGINFKGAELMASALHEITHAMGRTAGSAMDIFRYTAPGTHLFGADTPATAAAYFSIDGGNTDLADFGITSDPGDFLNSSTLTSNDAFNETVGTLEFADAHRCEDHGCSGLRLCRRPVHRRQRHHHTTDDRPNLACQRR